MGLHLENEVAFVKTPTIISNNPDCEFKTHNFSHFPKLKITIILKFGVLFFTDRESQKYSYPRTSGLAESVVNLTEGICLQK